MDDPRPGPRDGGPRPVLVAAAILVAVLAAYLPALGNGWIWDDDDYVTRNQAIQRADGIRDIWLRPSSLPQWYPVTHTSFWIEHRLWGLAPFGYHLVNVLLHAAGAFLLWRVLRALALPGAMIAALLFALHPVHVESVAWVTERKNVLSGVFYLLSLGLGLRYLGLETGEGAPPRRRRDYALALLFFLLALLSKSVTATLPAVVLVLAWWKTGRIDRRDLVPMVPFLVLGAGLGLATAHLEREHVGASGEEWALTPAQRLLVAGRAAWFYAGKLAWPADLAFVYPRWTPDPRQAWQWLFPLAALAALVLLWRTRRRIGRGPLAAALVFVGTLFPALGFLDVYPFRYSFVADHFQYLASAALLAAAGWILARAPGRTGWAAAPLLAILGVLAGRQCGQYRDAETLWRATLERNPSAWIAWNNLGVILEGRGRDGEAIPCFEKSLALQPRNHEAWNNLGNSLLRRGETGRAIECYARSLEIMPAFLLGHAGLGNALRAKGDLAGAEAAFRRGLSFRPDFYLSRWNLARLLRDAGRFEEAARECRVGLSSYPGDPKLSVELGRALAGGGRADEALPVLAEAARAHPGSYDAHLYLANVLFVRGRHAEAVAEYRTALGVRSTSEAHNNVALALKRTGEAAEAAIHFRDALRIDPANLDARANLARFLATTKDDALRDPAEAVRLGEECVSRTGREDSRALDALAAAYAAAGRFDEAVRTLEEALSLVPGDAAAEPGASMRLRLASYGRREAWRE